MQCNQAQELFSDHVAGHLDRALNVSVENHLRSCATCNAELIGLRRVWASLEALPSIEPPSFFHENLMHRIAMEQDKVTEAAQRRSSVWNWRSLFLPRSPVFAAAALMALALLGMGGLHIQHASLDPLGALLRLMIRHNGSTGAIPALQTARAEWHPNGQGGGTLTIYAQARPGTPVSVKALNYREGDRTLVSNQNDLPVSVDHETTIAILMEARPATDLTLNLSAPESQITATVPVTLMEPVSAPPASR